MCCRNAFIDPHSSGIYAFARSVDLLFTKRNAFKEECDIDPFTLQTGSCADLLPWIWEHPEDTTESTRAVERPGVI